MKNTITSALYGDLEQFAEHTFAELDISLDERDPNIACLLQGFADIANTLSAELQQAQHAQKIKLLNALMPGLLLDVPPLALVKIQHVQKQQHVPASTYVRFNQDKCLWTKYAN